MRASRDSFRTYRDLALAVLGVAVATCLFWTIRSFLGKWHAALLYLPVVVLAASLGGTRAGLVASILAFLTWDLVFIPPYYRLSASDPGDWISLFVFLLVGLAMGLQTGRLQERESEAHAREEEKSILYRLSAYLTSQTVTEAMARALSEEVVRAARAGQAILFLPDDAGELQPVPDAEPAEIDRLRDQARRAFHGAEPIGLPTVSSPAELGSAWDIPLRGIDPFRSPSRVRESLNAPTALDLYLPLKATAGVEGVLFVGAREDRAPYTVRDVRLLISICHLAAAFLERQRLQASASQADALREADRLKSTLVSSVSHELKTPLASIRAIVTDLLGPDVEWDPRSFRHDLEIVDDDLVRLDGSIDELLDLSRLEAGAWTPRRDWHELGDIFGTVLSRLPDSQANRVIFELPEDLPPIRADYHQLARALQHLIENAVIYSPRASLVRVTGSASSGEFLISVEDSGPGVSQEERSHLFDKFYRGRAASAAPSGTGLGLAITAEIVRCHRGRIWVEDARPTGARFMVSLPRDESNEEAP